MTVSAAHTDSWQSGAISATIAPNILRYLARVCAEHGLDLAPALDQVGLTPDLLDSPDLRVSFRQGDAVIRAALRQSPRPGLGLLVGSAQHLTASGLVGFGMMTAPALIDAIRLGVEFQNLAGSMVAWSVEESAETRVRAELGAVPDSDPVGRFLIEEGIANITRMVRSTLDPSWAPARVSFRHEAPSYADAYRSVFACPVDFGAAATLWTLHAGDASRPLPGADPWAHAQVRALLHEGTARLGVRQELYQLVEARIGRALPDVPAIADAARALHLTERTLRRRLADLGTTYAHIVDGVRRERGLHLLTEGTLPLAQIAAELGFGDERSLRRACVRWTGLSPRAVRAGPPLVQQHGLEDGDSRAGRSQADSGKQ
ncbi:AraC family transcriptional regulator [Mycetocola tolaasinivorans]|uniref:AraC family transcriptional regulator n=1 Tax=Mycetocola tolaasinivorans TaxID=76635 RepID=A0A3L7AC79_9MICO|nr:AraC family transcriptional regulator [Mycetocola tolaasinivorans]RLP78009.1 AraC family transcriptional regulator [Mycetocola tolaasinivorans]